jgi:hypothetical protein
MTVVSSSFPKITANLKTIPMTLILTCVKPVMKHLLKDLRHG